MEIQSKTRKRSHAVPYLALAGLLLSGWIPAQAQNRDWNRAHRIIEKKRRRICTTSSIMMCGPRPTEVITKRPSATSPPSAGISTRTVWTAASWMRPSGRSNTSPTSARLIGVPAKS